MTTTQENVIYKRAKNFVCFDSLRTINNLSAKQGRVFLDLTSAKLGLISLAQGHNAVMQVRLEPAAHKRAKRSVFSQQVPAKLQETDKTV